MLSVDAAQKIVKMPEKSINELMQYLLDQVKNGWKGIYDFQYINLDTVMPFNVCNSKNITFSNYSIRQFYELMVTQKDAELFALLESIFNHYLALRSEVIFENISVGFNVTMKKCWQVVFFGAFLQENHQAIKFLVSSNVMLGFDYVVNAEWYVKKHSKVIRQIIENAVREQKNIWSYMQFITKHCFTSSESMAIEDYEFLKFLFETLAVLKEQDSNGLFLECFRSSMALLICNKKPTDIPILRFIFEKYNDKLNLRKIWNECYIDVDIYESNIIRAVTPLIYSAANVGKIEDNYEVFKFLLLEVKLDIKLNENVLNRKYYFKNEVDHQPILWIAVHNWCLDQQKFLKEIVPVIILLLNQGVYLNHPSREKITLFRKIELMYFSGRNPSRDISRELQKNLEKNISNECQANIYKFHLQILKSAERLLELAQSQNPHNSAQKAEIEDILTLLKNGVNGRFIDDNKTALQYAIEFNHRELAHQLKRAGAHNNLQYFSGEPGSNSMSTEASTSTSAMTASTSRTASVENSAVDPIVFSNHKKLLDDMKDIKENIEVLQVEIFKSCSFKKDSVRGQIDGMIDVINARSDSSNNNPTFGLRKRTCIAKTDKTNYS